MKEEEIRYQEALDYIYSFVDYSLTRNFRNSPEKFDLGRIATLMEQLGNPQHDYPVVHVTGTKGKGSTSAMVASIAQAAGYKVGFYSSPHLQDFCERIRIDGKPISHEKLVEGLDRFKPYVARLAQITSFELTTALALWLFREEHVDLAVIEVGLGGRLDATNIVEPLVSVITSISYDHTNILGDTLAKIAYEKGGIIKPGRSLVLSPQKEEARTVIAAIAKERNAPLIQVGKDVLFAAASRNLDGQNFLIWSAEEQPLVNEFIESAGRITWEPSRFNIPLLGYHQIENAATAFAAVQLLKKAGFNISERQIVRGYEKVEWPCRFEVISRTPLLVIDSAHNRDSALKLRLAIEDYFPGKPVVMLFGASEDKDIEGMFTELAPRMRTIVASQSVHPRAMEADKLVELAHRFGRPSQAVVPVENALEKALAIAGDEAAVVVAGSLFIAAAVHLAWEQLQTSNPSRNF